MIARTRQPSQYAAAVTGPEAISPTAHYTGETWVRNGLSHPELETWQGRALHRALALPFAASRALGGPTLNGSSTRSSTT
jgi:hypothetical protein